MRMVAIRLLVVFALLPLLTSLAGAQKPFQALTAQPAKPAPPPLLPQPVLDHIRANNALVCGLAKEEEDYSRDEDHGNRAALDIDLCKAVAVAVLGPGARVVLKSFPDEATAVDALRRSNVDLLASTSISVDNSAQGLILSPPVFFDGQGFLIASNPAIHGPLDLAGKKVCFATNSVAQSGAQAFAEQHRIRYIWYPFSEDGEMEAAFFTGNCDAITSDVSRLANIRAIDPRRAHDFVILPQIIRQDPLAAATLGTDARFAAIVRWTVETLFAAEQLGITAANAKTMTSDPRSEIQQILGQRFGTGTHLGIDPHWGLNVIEAVGNYGEIYDRDLGAHSELHVERHEDRLWTDGGLVLPVLPSIH